MELEIILKMVFGVIGGLGIFLLGMKNMSDGMQAVAGNKMRKLINAVTSNRLVACGIGAIITSVIQSSSVTTVMVVGMVNAELMTLTQAIGVILGANIGTTITAWILVLDLTQYGLPLLGLSALVFLFAKRERLRYTATVLLGLGMVFFGLELMAKGFGPLKDMPEVLAWFSRFKPDTFFGIIKCVLVGMVVTGIVQSSSATVGITMGLALTGIIDYQTAGALVLGQNIGTTITALLASLGAATNAKRAAYAHTIFNFLGVLWVIPIFHWYMKGVVWFVGIDPNTAVYTDAGATYPHALAAIAATHSGFNLLNVLAFLPFTNLLAKFLVKIVPDKHLRVPHLTVLDVRMLDAPAIGIQQSQKEILRMSSTVANMLSIFRDLLSGKGSAEQQQEILFKSETDLDVIQKEIVEFISTIMAGTITHELMNQSRSQLRMADEYESISDYITNILKLKIKLDKAGLHISDDGLQDLLALHDRVAEYIRFINESVQNDDEKILMKAQIDAQAITRRMKENRSRHLARMEGGTVSPIKSLYYVDMLNSYRRIKDHAYNIAEVLAGEK